MKPSTRILTLVIVSLWVETSSAQSPVERVESQSGKAWVTPEVKATRVSLHTFDSDAAKGKVSYHIYTPAEYDREPERRFPVVYWLQLAEQNAEAIIRGSLVRQVCGDEDETFGQNRNFHEHLERLKIPHAWTVLPGVEHNPMKTLQALGDSNWAFYREAFGDPKQPNN